MALLRFGKFYKFINELPPGDRPNDVIIESDSRVDEWYESFVRQKERAYLKAMKGTGGHAKESAKNRIPTFQGM